MAGVIRGESGSLGFRFGGQIDDHLALVAVTARGVEAEFTEEADGAVIGKLCGKKNLAEPHLERPGQRLLAHRGSQRFLSIVLMDKDGELNLRLADGAKDGVGDNLLAVKCQQLVRLLLKLLEPAGNARKVRRRQALGHAFGFEARIHFDECREVLASVRPHIEFPPLAGSDLCGLK
ncbi:hypothetical protein SBA2_740035 [Acidobacteriia bacterium SbA2]|nr:hypothetical protein SBA2_740035 [Acidobacteriia bacterium SbA2]